jgi:hypothetical protein
VHENALAETHHPHILRGFSPLDGLPNFYGLGMNVSYDQQGRLRLNHSGAFALGAAIPANGPDLLCDDDVGAICWRFDLNLALMAMPKRPNLSAGRGKNPPRRHRGTHRL